MNKPETPTLRKPAGMFMILGIIAGWTVLIVAASPWVGTLAWYVQAVFYLVVGIVWIVPLGPILRWMETGRFTA